MRILVIEDDLDIARRIVLGLKEDCFAVDYAPTRDAGLRLARSTDYDALILDTLASVEDSVCLCAELRRLGKSCGIIVLSDVCELQAKIRMLDAGADDYLVLPVSFEELRARVRAILRRERRIIEPQLYAADLVMDTIGHSVTRGGKCIRLSRKEFTLLEYLLRNKGRILTRGMILEHAWDMYADPCTNTVDVHIRFLREKIDKPYKRKLLRTVHGYGYKIED